MESHSSTISLRNLLAMDPSRIQSLGVQLKLVRACFVVAGQRNWFHNGLHPPPPPRIRLLFPAPSGVVSPPTVLVIGSRAGLTERSRGCKWTYLWL